MSMNLPTEIIHDLVSEMKHHDNALKEILKKSEELSEKIKTECGNMKNFFDGIGAK